MKRLFLVAIIFLLSWTSSSSQEKPRTVEWNGKTYLVYPYKYGKEYSYSYSYETIPGANDNESEVVPYPGNLPDGNYIMYNEPVSKYRRKIWFFHRRGTYYMDSTIVAAIFSLKENQKQGEAVFYDNYSNPVEQGNYHQNLKEGIWKRKSYKDISSHNIDLGDRFENDMHFYTTVIEYLNYEKGIREGKYRSFIDPNDGVLNLLTCDSSKMNLVSSGNYHLNKVNGNWSFYYKNKQLATRYSLTDSLGLPSLNNFNNIYSYGKKTLYFNGWHETYYPNGQLFNRKLYEYGYATKYDTAFLPDGKIKWKYSVKTVEEKDTVSTHVDYFYYDSLGRMETHTFSKDEESVFSRYYSEGKFLCTENLQLAYYDLKDPDTLVPVTIYYDCYEDSNQTRINEIIFKHPETNTALRRSFDHSDYDYYEQADDFEFRSDKASHIYYITEIDFKGKNKEMEVRTYKHLYRSPYYELNRSYITELDSVVLLVNGKRFNGKYISMDGSWRKKKGKVKIQDDKVKIYSYYYGGRIDGTPSFGYNSKRLFIAYDRRRWRFALRRKVYTTYSGKYVNGLMQGEWIEREKRKGRINTIANYDKGGLHGKQFTYGYEKADRWSNCKEIHDKQITKKKGWNRKGRYYLSDLDNYENDELHGTQMEYYCSGRLMSRLEMKNGMYDGIHEVYSESGNLTKKAFYNHGYFDGKYQEWSPNKKERYNVNFEEGVLVGEYNAYHFNGTPFYQGNLSQGYKIGDWFTYFEEGNIKFKDIYTMEDSSYFGFNNFYLGATVRPEISEHNLNSCYSMQYFPSGQLATEGKIKRNTRIGIWKFYDEGGNLIRQINYEPGKFPIVDANGKTDTIHHFGFYESWYSNGQKQSEAYVLAESTKFDCYQEVNISLQDLFYENYWDKNENQTIKNRTGRLISYHLTTGKPESEGEMINGKKTGYWRYWDPEGRLTSVGNYENDLQQGRWLFGDLEGMHYLDDACFDISDPRVMEEMEYKKKKLSISEIFYLNGKLIKENKFSVDLNRN